MNLVVSRLIVRKRGNKMKKIKNIFIRPWLRQLCQFWQISLFLLMLGATSLTHAQQNILTNGNFSTLPTRPLLLGNNIGFGNTELPGWIFTGSSTPNLVKVNPGPPDNFFYYTSVGQGGPDSDVTNPSGLGYYLDITDGENAGYQVFTVPLCGSVTSVPYKFGGYFSTRDGQTGIGALRIREGTGLSGASVASASKALASNNGGTANATWTQVTQTVNLTPGRVYTFVLEMDNYVNFDEATLVPVGVGCAEVTAIVDIPKASAPVGSTVTGTVSFANTSANTASGLTLTLQLSPGLVGVNVVSPVLGTGAYDSGSGIVTFLPTNIPANITPNTAITAAVSFTQPNSVVNVVATVGAVNDANSANNTGADSVAPLAADMSAVVDIPQAAAPVGSTVNGTVSFVNTSANPASSPTFILKLTPNLVGVNVVSPALGTGVYDPITGTVTFPVANVPGSVAPNTTITAAISFTQPNSPVSVTATTGATNDTNSANNTGVDSVAPLAANMGAVVDIPQASAPVGSTVNGTVSFANTSANTATSPTFTLKLTPGLANVSVVSTVLGVGVYSPADGIVTFPSASIPANVTPNTTITAAISFTQPNSPVNVTATTGATNDTQPANNTGTDSVAPQAADTRADMTAVVDIPQAAAPVGSTVNGTVSFANTSANTAIGLTLSLQLSPGLAGVNVTSAALGTGVYNSATGLVTFPSVPASVAPNTALTAAISFTQPNSVVNVTATTGAANDANPANNTGADSVAPLVADMTAVVDIPQAAAPVGSTVNGTVSFANTSANTAIGLTLSLQLSPGLAGVNVTSAALGTGVYNSATGLVTFPSVPASVAPNTALTAAISFTQPNSVVNVTATTGAANDANPANNIGADSVLPTGNTVPATDNGTAPTGTTTVAIANVAANDSVNGAPATLGTAGNATISAGVLPTGVTFNTTTGAVTVSPSTPPGTYTFSYTLCDKNTPANCAPVTGTLVVTSAIVPATDNGTAPAGTTTVAIANVAANDSVNGAPATLGAAGNAAISAGVLPTGVTLNTTTGAVTVSPSTPPGTYTFSYTLCDKNTPANCAPVTGTLVVTPAKGTISGIAWVDSNGNGALDVSEPRVPNLRVGVFTTSAAGVRTELTNSTERPITNAAGQYRIPDLPSSDFGGPTFEVVFFNEAGQAVLGTPKSMSGTTNDGTVPITLDRIVGVKVSSGGETTLQNLPLDPSGVVYDSASRAPVAGAVVTFIGPPSFDPAVHLVGGAANANQTTGASGIYKFLLLAGAPAGIYGLKITPPATYTLSASIPAQVGPFPSAGPAGGVNAVVPNAQAPQTASNEPTTYYLSFQLIPGTSADVVHNHIPLDSGVQYKLAVSKAANRASGELGDTVLYTVKLRNMSQAAVPSGTTITDRLPAGFKYIPGTSQGTPPGTSTSTAIPDPAGGSGPVLDYTIAASLPVGAEYSLQYRVRIGVGALQGDGINRVQAKIGKSASNTAQAKVVVQGGVFSSDACLAGKVFVDCNNNHIQDAEEVGVPGVRLYLSDGTYFITDSEGKYSYCGLQPKSYVLSIDMLTMPRGSRMTTTSNRNLGDANSLFLDVKNGQLIRPDFAEGSCSNTVMEQANARRAKGEIRAPETEKTGQPAQKWEGKSPRFPQQGTNSADQILIAPRPANGGATSVPEQNAPVPQMPAASSNTRGANVREAK